MFEELAVIAFQAGRAVLRPYLVRMLVLPLTSAAAAMMWVSTECGDPWAGLIVNLAATCLGTIITVFFVDIVLRHHEAARWRSVESKLSNQLETVANTFLTSIRTSLGISGEVLDLRPEIAGHPLLLREMMVRVAQNVLLPRLSQIRKLDRQEWKHLVVSLAEAIKATERVLDLFGRHLRPAEMELLLNLQESVRKIQSTYQMLPDFFGARADELPPKTDGSSSKELQEDVYALVQSHLVCIVNDSCHLLSRLPEPHIVNI